jgi:serine/threonine-protein kinase
VAQDGSLVYLAGDVDIEVGAKRTLVWVDRRGREEAINAPPRAYVYPRISPDGTKVAVDVRDQDLDIWVWNFARATLTRLTFDPGLDQSPLWTPDGRRVVFGSTPKEPMNLFWQAADGTGAVERLTTSPNSQFPNAFSPDLTRLVLWEERPGMGSDLFILTMEGERRVQPLIQTSFSEHNAEVSPDGRWLTYQSNESGQFEVYVRPFPQVDGGRWQVSTGGGTAPVWARSGRGLFYFVAPRADDDGADSARPHVYFRQAAACVRGPVSRGNTGRTYDVSADGQRFLMIKEAASTNEAAAPPQIVVVQNWHEELKRLVPR